MAYVVLLVCLLLVSSIASEYTIYINGSSFDAINSTKCGTVSTPCQTFDIGLEVAQSLLKNNMSITLAVAEGEYRHSSNTNGLFYEVFDFGLVGQGSMSTVISCNSNSGFRFVKSYNIKVYGIAFIGCGQMQNSTSYNYKQYNSGFYLFCVSLYFLYCHNINLTSIAVIDSNAIGIVLYNIVGTNVIDNVMLADNQFGGDTETNCLDHIAGGGGGLYIEYSYCVPGDETGINCLQYGTTNVDVKYTKEAVFYITNSTFKGNIANISNFDNNTFILPHKQYHAAFGRGGGLSVFVKGNASNNYIEIDNCTFKDNQAVWGGGMFAEFQDTSHDNVFVVRSSLLENNTLYYNGVRNEGTGGGGARMGYIYFNNFTSYGNNITFIQCNFTNNSAYYGGALSFYSSRQSNYQSSVNAFKLHHCYFSNNSGRLGAALDISLWHSSIEGRDPYLVIANCAVINNKAIEQSNGGLIGIGAVYIDSLPVSFIGNISFYNNSGSALAVTGSYITIGTNAYVTFIGNRGRNGGAIALYGNTFIVTNESSTLSFINNTAQYKGGAIYFYSSGQRDLLSSRNCFIRFNDITAHPQDWTSKFYFQGNSVQTKEDNQPNAIYATSLLSCIWGGSYGSYLYNVSRSEVFCWNENWTYKESSSANESQCNKQISSAPTSFRNVKSTYRTLPGKQFHLEYSVYTDLQSNVTEKSVLVARILNGSATFHGAENFDYVSNTFLDISGQPDSNVTIQLETFDPVVVKHEVSIQLGSCPPGFIPPSNNTNDTFSCECYGPSSYLGYIRCDNNNFISYIRRTTWFGSMITNCKQPFYVVGESPYLYSTMYEQYITLYNGSETYLNDLFCGPSGRKGVLCGSCQNGTGVALTSDTYYCVECPSYGWLLYLLTTYLPITIFFALIFLFSMTVTSGPLNSFLFFAQVISTTIEVDADSTIPLHNTTSTVSYSALKELYIIPYSIWNMNFFRGLVGKFCVNTEINTLDVMLLSYGEALYPLLLLLIVIPLMVMYNKGIKFIVYILRPLHYCLVRFRQLTTLRHSVTGGIAVFIIISYTKFTLISLLVLTQIPLYNISGDMVQAVHYYAGDLEYPNYNYVIPAYLILLTFGIIPPILLMYPSFLRLLEQLSCWRLKLTKLYPPLNIKLFLDEFHGCYKDGSDGGIDCRWFSGLHFILRLILFVVYAYTDKWELQYISQLILLLIVTFLFALIRPYKKDWNNTLDVGFFLILVAITSMSLYNLTQTYIDQPLSTDIFTLQYILIFIPLLYCVGYYTVFFSTKFILPCTKNLRQRLHNRRKPDEAQSEQLQVQKGITYQDALVESTHISDFLEYIDEDFDCGRKYSNVMSTQLGNDDSIEKD